MELDIEITNYGSLRLARYYGNNNNKKESLPPTPSYINGWTQVYDEGALSRTISETSVTNNSRLNLIHQEQFISAQFSVLQGTSVFTGLMNYGMLSYNLKHVPVFDKLLRIKYVRTKYFKYY